MKWISFCTKLQLPPEPLTRGAIAPRSPSSLSSVLNWICWTPIEKISWVRHCVHCITSHFEWNGEAMFHVTMDSVNLFAPPVNDWRSERAPANINYCGLPSYFFVPMKHSHCCTWTMLGTVFTNHSSAMDKSWIMSWWFCQNKFHHLHCVHMFLICQSEMCNHYDGCQPTFELSAPSPYMMQSQYTVTKQQY